MAEGNFNKRKSAGVFGVMSDEIAEGNFDQVIVGQ
jgi:hypothetical protein